MVLTQSGGVVDVLVLIFLAGVAVSMVFAAVVMACAAWRSVTGKD